MLHVTVNGKRRELDVDPRHTLLEVLRDKLGLTGTKEGCGEGECGACTVLVNGQTVNSCLYLAGQAEGASILTVEGLAQEGELHPIQRAFIDQGAVQCGFCTPGMILSAVVLLEREPHPSRDQIKQAIAGNLCRCTGYVKILRAIETASRTISKRDKSERTGSETP